MKEKNALAVLGAAMLLAGTPAYAAGEEDNCRFAYKAKQAEAYELCLPLAKDNKTEFQRYIGDMYFFGWEAAKLAQSYPDALQWYRRASANGDVEAKYDMGVLYENGWGTPKNPDQAVKWYRSAAKDGNRAAQLNLGNMYSKGSGIVVNDRRASEWYLRAAKQGDAVAQYNIGTRYAKGTGIEVDYVEAYKYLWLADQAKVAEAKASLSALARQIPSSDRMEGEKQANAWKPVEEKPESSTTY